MRFAGRRVTEAREAAGLSKTDLAFRVRRLNHELRPDASAISKIERDLHDPSANLVAAIAQATGQDIDFFYEAEGEDGEAEADMEAALARKLRASANRKMGEAAAELVEAAELDRRVTR
jgi:transcriptional regulator with XRE-family HTH domain